MLGTLWQTALAPERCRASCSRAIIHGVHFKELWINVRKGDYLHEGKSLIPETVTLPLSLAYGTSMKLKSRVQDTETNTRTFKYTSGRTKLPWKDSSMSSL